MSDTMTITAETTAPTCWACEGTGTDWGQTCQVCEGTGHTTEGLPAGIPAAGTSVDFLQGNGPTSGSKGVTSTDDEVRWTKVGATWAIKGPAHLLVEGQVVTVTKRSGETSTVTVGKLLLSPDRWGNVTAEVAPKAQSTNAPTNTPKVEDGRLYWTSDRRIVEAKLSKAQRFYGLLVDPETAHRDYAPGIIKDVVEPLTLEEAKAFGRRTGVCCQCGRKLTNPTSVQEGIGPICGGRWAS